MRGCGLPVWDAVEVGGLRWADLSMNLRSLTFLKKWAWDRPWLEAFRAEFTVAHGCGWFWYNSRLKFRFLDGENMAIGMGGLDQ